MRRIAGLHRSSRTGGGRSAPGPRRRRSVRRIAVLGLLLGSISGVGATQASAAGEYAIPGLASGNYRVFFAPPEGANYIFQVFNGKSLFEEARPVSATAPKGSSPTPKNSSSTALPPTPTANT